MDRPSQRSGRARRHRGPGRPAGGQPREGQEALLAAARELMEEKGLARLRLREVAGRAGVKPALVHYYFGDRRGLLQALVTEVASRMLAGATHAAGRSGSFEERLRAVVREMVEMLRQDPYAPRLVVEQVLFGDEETIDRFVDQFARRNLALMQELLDDARRDDRLRDVEPMFLVPMLFGSSLFFFLAAPVVQRLFGVSEITPELAERFADHTVDVVLNGILARPGKVA